ncbi:MAG: family 10 glycosylhydrolase [Oscillatoriophycideae cyanobacterium NC_groundwater_1537_Pr4_S-0.65um_50_18]|nr:family 10 glycosylhydrolase [Oscillatoriophycideae cyanobacterium NC_groundwater_1537_Pr4_S-0.65um_50_18]
MQSVMRRRFFGVWLSLFCLTCSLLLPLARPGLTQTGLPTAQELRGVWLTTVDSDVLFSHDRLKPALQTLADLHFNTVYPAVWNWGYTLYPSQTAAEAIGHATDPRVPDLKAWDALADVVELGHQQGLTVMPWFEFGFMTTADSELVTQHPDWISDRQDGSQIWQDGIYQRRWLNPFKPEVQQFIQSLILEIVTRYDVDGIQFDDHFGLPAEFGYDDFTQRLYQQEHQGRLPSSDPGNAEWVRWRAAKITAFTKQVFHAIKAQKPNVVVALSPNTYAFSYRHYLQDWKTWERSGLIEELTLQVYRDSLSDFVADLARPEVLAAKQHIPVSIGILTGLKDLPVSIDQVEAQVASVRDRQFAGISFFFYESLWNLSGQGDYTLNSLTLAGHPSRHTVFRRLFSTPADRPNLLDNWMPPR